MHVIDLQLSPRRTPPPIRRHERALAFIPFVHLPRHIRRRTATRPPTFSSASDFSLAQVRLAASKHRHLARPRRLSVFPVLSTLSVLSTLRDLSGLSGLSGRAAFFVSSATSRLGRGSLTDLARPVPRPLGADILLHSFRGALSPWLSPHAKALLQQLSSIRLQPMLQHLQ
jgi:hypothetical protein